MSGDTSRRPATVRCANRWVNISLAGCAASAAAVMATETVLDSVSVFQNMFIPAGRSDSLTVSWYIGNLNFNHDRVNAFWCAQVTGGVASGMRSVQSSGLCCCSSFEGAHTLNA